MMEAGGLPSGLGGYGPWYCTLLFNTSKNSKKQTHLVAHSTPSLFPLIMNGLSARRPPAEQQAGGIGWVIMQQIGPFKSWGNCIAFLALWTNKTRGKTRRLERGVNLFTTYATAEEEKLTMWTRMDTKEDAILKHNTQQQQRKRHWNRTRAGKQYEKRQLSDEKRQRRRKLAEDGAVICERDFFSAMDKLDSIFSLERAALAAVLDGDRVRVHTIKGFEK